MTAPTIIAEWDRNSREVVRVALDTYQGRSVISVRVWYRDGGALRPGRDGLTLGAAHHLPRLADALARALREAERVGILDA